MNRIRKSGFITCISTHNPGITIPAIDKMQIDVSCILTPLNKTGNHVHPTLDACIAAIQNTKKKVIGMKVLSCGELKPLEAFKFAFQYVKSVMVGFTEEWQIEEAYKALEKIYYEIYETRS